MELQSSGVSMEMITYNSLTNEEKDLILVSPKDSSVEKVAVSQEIVSMIDEEYEKVEVYRVIFNNTDSNNSGKLVVFVDLDGETVVGKGFTNN